MLENSSMMFQSFWVQSLKSLNCIHTWLNRNRPRGNKKQYKLSYYVNMLSKEE